MDGSHVAQLNVARLLAPLDSPQLAEFVANLEPVNAVADASPGFIWRLQTADGDATSVRILDDDRLIVNLSVWESLDALRDFVFRSRHAEVLKRRHDWFERMNEAYLAVWWIDVGTVPTVEDAVERLLLLRRIGPSTDAFTLKEPFPPPS